MLARRTGWSLLLLVVCFAGACASSSDSAMVNMWRADASPGGRMQRIVVMTADEDFEFRKGFDDRFVQLLAQRGATGIPWYSLMSITDMPTPAMVETAVQRSDADGVLVLRMVGLRGVDAYRPGYVDEVPGPQMVTPFGNVIPTWEQVRGPSRVRADAVLRMEASLYSAQGRLLWTGTSRTIDPGSDRQIQTQVAADVIRELSRVGFIR